MCVIAYKPKGTKMFPKENVKLMVETNPHGAGVAYIDEVGKVVMRKGMMTYEDLQKYLDDIPNPTDKDIVLHSRITTSGGTSQINCHPYPLHHANDSLFGIYDTVMFHNGILDHYGYVGELEGENDTQAFIRECANLLPDNFLENQAILNLIEKSIGDNKLCFLSKNGVTMIGNFIKEDGYYYSNTHWKPWTSHSSCYNNFYSYNFWDQDDEEYFNSIAKEHDKKAEVKENKEEVELVVGAEAGSETNVEFAKEGEDETINKKIEDCFNYLVNNFDKAEITEIEHDKDGASFYIGFDNYEDFKQQTSSLVPFGGNDPNIYKDKEGKFSYDIDLNTHEYLYYIEAEILF